MRGWLRDWVLLPLKVCGWIIVILASIYALYWMQVTYEKWRAEIFWSEMPKQEQR